MAWEWSLLELQLGDVVGSLVALLRVGILLVVETNGCNGKRNKANFGKLQTKENNEPNKTLGNFPAFQKISHHQKDVVGSVRWLQCFSDDRIRNLPLLSGGKVCLL